MILLQPRHLPDGQNVTDAVSDFTPSLSVTPVAKKLLYHIGAVYSLLWERLPITKGGTKAGFFV